LLYEERPGVTRKLQIISNSWKRRLEQLISQLIGEVYQMSLGSKGTFFLLPYLLFDLEGEKQRMWWKLARQAREQCESGVYHVAGVTLRQIARVTGINAMNVHRA